MHVVLSAKLFYLQSQFSQHIILFPIDLVIVRKISMGAGIGEGFVSILDVERTYFSASNITLIHPRSSTGMVTNKISCRSSSSKGKKERFLGSSLQITNKPHKIDLVSTPSMCPLRFLNLSYW